MRTAAIHDLTAFLMHRQHFLHSTRHPSLLDAVTLIPPVFITCIFAQSYLKRLIVLLFQLPFRCCWNHKVLDLGLCADRIDNAHLICMLMCAL
jgi:hypothetical protein